MKEVTYEEWQKNPTVRMMWVWNDDDEYKKKKYKVLYILSTKESPVSEYRVIALTIEHNCVVRRYAHCAEIEEPETRRMTNKELSRWLRENPTREYKYNIGRSVYSIHNYDEDCGDGEVREDVVIREDDREWREPLVEE